VHRLRRHVGTHTISVESARRDRWMQLPMVRCLAWLPHADYLRPPRSWWDATQQPTQETDQPMTHQASGFSHPSIGSSRSFMMSRLGL